MSEPHHPVEHKNRFPLLPNYCKKVGLVMFLLVMLTLIISYRSIEYANLTNTETGVKWIVKSLLIISILLIIFSKERIENYRTAARRKKAIVMALVIMPLGLLLTYFIGEDKILTQLAWLAVRQSFVWYLISFYLIDYPWHIEFKKKSANLENDLG